MVTNIFTDSLTDIDTLKYTDRIILNTLFKGSCQVLAFYRHCDIDSLKRFLVLAGIGNLKVGIVLLFFKINKKSTINSIYNSIIIYLCLLLKNNLRKLIRNEREALIQKT